MEFTLCYRGPLKSTTKSKGRLPEKHRLRRTFHEQLKHIWDQKPLSDHPEQVTQASNVINAAKDSGNDPRIVRLSVHQASHEAPSRNSRQHAQIEDQLRSSGLPYTLLGPTTFMQNTLTTHDKEGQTKYWRIRAFDKVAERVRDTVRKGQKDVEAVVYGPKQWTQKKKTDTGWTQETVQGYYAGMVRVPDK